LLYPLKFDPIYKQLVWGGINIARYFHRDIPLNNVAESWELCCHNDGTSIVSSGALKGMSLQSLILKYRGELLGEKIYKKFGAFFPLLIKIIDANKNLSVQVHPDDAYARAKGEENGKNELWYILDTKERAKLVYGVKKNQSKEDFVKAVSENKIEQTLNLVDVKPGDVFYVPAGKVHAILGGILLVEIQQNSNTTYRLSDWGRVDENGQGRTLHIAQALEVIDFNSPNQPQGCPQIANNQDYSAVATFRSAYFNVDKIDVHQRYKSTTMDCFRVLMCIKGEGVIHYNGGACGIMSGETVLLPACLGEYEIDGNMTLLSIYI